MTRLYYDFATDLANMVKFGRLDADYCGYGFEDGSRIRAFLFDTLSRYWIYTGDKGKGKRDWARNLDRNPVLCQHLFMASYGSHTNWEECLRQSRCRHISRLQGELC